MNDLGNDIHDNLPTKKGAGESCRESNLTVKITDFK